MNPIEFRRGSPSGTCVMQEESDDSTSCNIPMRMNHRPRRRLTLRTELAIRGKSKLVFESVRG